MTTKSFYRMRQGLTVLCLGLMLWSVFAAPAAEPTEPPKASFPLSLPLRTVRVGLYPIEGYHHYQDREPVGGYGYDYLQMLRTYAPWEYEYVGEESGWPELYGMLLEGKIDLITNMRKTPEREGKLAFSAQPMGEASAILTLKSGNQKYHVDDYKNWNGMRIGVLRNIWLENLEHFAKEKGFTYTIVRYESTRQLLQALQEGKEIDVCLTHNLRTLRNEWVLDIVNTEPFYVAVRKGDPQLLDELNHAMGQIRVNDSIALESLWRKYFTETPSDEIQFTEAERSFIAQMKERGQSFTAILNPDRFPLSYRTNGIHLGIVKDVADEVIRRTGLDIQFLPVEGKEECLKAYLDESVDFVFDAKNDLRDAERKNLVLTQPYISYSASMLFNRKHADQIKEFILVRNSWVTLRIIPYLPKGAQVHYCDTVQEAVAGVTSGQYDATYLYTAGAEYADWSDAKSRLARQLVPGLRFQLAVGIREDRNPLLASILNKSVESLDESFIEGLREKHSLYRQHDLSLSYLFNQYPWVFLGIPALFLLLLSLFLWRTLVARRKFYILGCVFNKMPFRYFIADGKGRLIQYNYGKEESLFNLKSLDDVVDEKVRLPIQEVVTKALESNKTEEALYTDQTRIRRAMVTRLPDSLFGRPTVLGVSRDVTDLMESYKKAQKSDEYFRLTLSSVGDGVIATDKEGRVTMLNPVAEHLIGIKQEMAIGLPHEKFFRIVQTDEKVELMSPVYHALQSGKMEVADHTDLLSLDGEHRYHISDSASPVFNDEKEIIGAILVFRDVTQEYDQRSKIAVELANWNAAAKIADLHTFSFDPLRHEATGSPGLGSVWPLEEGHPLPAEQWVHPEDLPRWKQIYFDILSGKITQCTLEFRSLQNETIRYFRGYLRAAEKPDMRVTGLVQEVTSFVEAQKGQEAIRNLWTTCIETAPVLMFIKSVENDYRYQQCNTLFAKFLGYSVAEVIGHTDEELCNSSLLEKIREADRKVMAQGKSLTLYEDVSGLDGVKRTFLTVKTPTVGLDGKPVLLGMALDVTEAYQNRMRIQRMLESWKIASKHARIATYRLDEQLQVLSYIGDIGSLWPHGENGRPIPPEAYLHPEDVDLYYQMYSSIQSGKVTEATQRLRVIHPGGVHNLCLYVQKDPRNPREIIGIMQDVSDLVQEESKMQTIQRQWASVIDSLPLLFFIKDIDNDFRYLQVNRQFAKFYGMKAADVLGKRDCDCIRNEDELQMYRKNDLEALQRDKGKTVIETTSDATGRIRKFLTVKFPSINEEGKRILICMSQDVTDLQEKLEMQRILSKAFETLFTSNNLRADLTSILGKICDFTGFNRAYITCMDSANNSLLLYTSYVPGGEEAMCDPDNYRIEHVNQLPWYEQVCKNMGSHQEFLIDFTNPQDMEAARFYTPNVYKNAKKYDFRGAYLHYINVDGKPWGTIGFIARGRAMKKLSENERFLLKTMAHLVELSISRKRTLVQLKSALDAALEADKAKSFFISSMSHEIRTPLNGVIGLTDILRISEPLTESQKEMLDDIYKSSNALLKLLSNILDLSKIESGKVVLHPTKTNLQELMDEMKDLFHLSAEQKKLTLEFKPFSIPDLYFDQPLLRQVFFNLMSNAVKYTQKGCVSVSLNFEKNPSEETGTLTLTVTDTGMGMNADDQEKAFIPFAQMSRFRGTSTEGYGTGLGLVLVKKIMEQLGGSIDVQSELDKGSTFTAQWPGIPMAMDEAQERTIDVEKLHLSDEIVENQENKIAPKVLVVDDSSVALEILSRMLDWLQVPHSKAGSPHEALELLEKEPFDIVMIDFLMPEMNGDELAQRIRSNPNWKKIQIVAMSTENESKMYDKSLFDKVMRKPIIRNALYKGIFGDKTKTSQIGSLE